jgi:ATP-dependent 26S proteasome regulatory subunit
VSESVPSPNWRERSGIAPTDAEGVGKRADPSDLQWAIQRRIEDVFAKLGEKFGDLTGRVETKIHPNVSFDEVGGLKEAKATLRGFAYALTSPELYARWGIRPPRGLLLYGPPGTGKATLARALATAAEAIFYHLKLLNLTTKFGANTGELLQEILRIAVGEGRGVLLLDEADALALEHLLPPPQAREASARLVAALCERLDGLEATARILVLASTSRTDVVDPALVAPGRLDHLVEVALPDVADQQEILDLIRAKIERNAGRTVFAAIDYRTVLPVMGGMSGAEMSQIVQRALETKVHRAAATNDSSLVTTEDLLVAIDEYKHVRGVVEKIRYGQYL